MPLPPLPLPLPLSPVMEMLRPKVPLRPRRREAVYGLGVAASDRRVELDDAMVVAREGPGHLGVAVDVGHAAFGGLVEEVGAQGPRGCGVGDDEGRFHARLDVEEAPGWHEP